MDVLKQGLHTLVIEGEEVVDDMKREVKSLIICTDEHAEEVTEVARNVQEIVGDGVDDLQGAVSCGLRKLLYPVSLIKIMLHFMYCKPT